MELHPLIWVLIFAGAVMAMVIVISFIIALSVAVAGRRFGDKLQNQHQTKIRQLLPGKDCGRCGCENCDGFARAVLFGAVAENACPYGEAELPEKMIAIVNEMQKKMEDPRPLQQGKHRMKTVWEQKF